MTVLFCRRGHTWKREGEGVRCIKCGFRCDYSRAIAGGPPCKGKM